MAGFSMGMVGPTQFGAAAKAQSTAVSNVATGKTVKNAADDPATFAIAQQMMSEKSGYDATNGALALGATSAAVSRGAAEAIVGLVSEIQQKTILAGAVGDAADALQDEIGGLVEQIDGIARAAGFGGENLINGAGQSSTLSAVFTDAQGQVRTTSVTMDRTDLTSSGALSALASIDVSTEAGRSAALSTLDSLAVVVTEAAAALGAAENQMNGRQSDVQDARDGYELAIAATVGADMPAESSKLAAHDAHMQAAIAAAAAEDVRNTSLLRLFNVSA